ncbi:MAG: geranylgeranylglyceryl/heptaprenylglyceryl phosphate synthase [Cyclobacteriaceae bacterium]
MVKNSKILEQFISLKKSGKKGVALLIDPEKTNPHSGTQELIKSASKYGIDFFFVGGSLGDAFLVEETIRLIKLESRDIPLVLFPGNMMQVSENADGLLFLSLISGRNPDLLIGQHVLAAPSLSKSNLEIMPTGYMLVDGGGITSVQYISQTVPLPHNKPELAVATALAGKFLGLSLFYLDAGSGANYPVPAEMISAVNEAIEGPLIVGGGINTATKAKNAWEAGADVVVIGNGAEKNPDLITGVLHYAKIFNASLNVN